MSKRENTSTALQKWDSDRVLEEVEQHKITQETDDKAQQKRVLVRFSLDSEQYGIDARYIETIVESKTTFKVPCVPEYIVGVINLRGEIVSTIDLRLFFGLPPKDTDENTRIIIVTHDDVKVGFFVDFVWGIINIPASSIQPSLSTIEKIKADYFDGEAYIDGKLLGIVSVGNILKIEETMRTGQPSSG